LTNEQIANRFLLKYFYLTTDDSRIFEGNWRQNSGGSLDYNNRVMTSEGQDSDDNSGNSSSKRDRRSKKKGSNKGRKESKGKEERVKKRE
jgi:hypothetical protein